jgi:hypothetical protein
MNIISAGRKQNVKIQIHYSILPANCVEALERTLIQCVLRENQRFGETVDRNCALALLPH